MPPSIVFWIWSSWLLHWLNFVWGRAFKLWITPAWIHSNDNQSLQQFWPGISEGFVSFGLWIIMNRFCGRPDFKKVRKGRLDWYVHVFCGYSFAFCENYLKKYERYCRLICIDLYWWIFECLYWFVADSHRVTDEFVDFVDVCLPLVNMAHLKLLERSTCRIAFHFKLFTEQKRHFFILYQTHATHCQGEGQPTSFALRFCPCIPTCIILLSQRFVGCATFWEDHSGSQKTRWICVLKCGKEWICSEICSPFVATWIFRIHTTGEAWALPACFGVKLRRCNLQSHCRARFFALLLNTTTKDEVPCPKSGKTHASSCDMRQWWWSDESWWTLKIDPFGPFGFGEME